MSQVELLPANDATVIDRPLIAFAFLAQATQVQGDLMSGLAPIFKPIVKLRVGKKFDANEFAQAVATLYGIKIHPWAVDDLATRLERAGLLVRSQVGADAHEYVYANVDGTFDEVTEAHIRHVVEKFIQFSRPLLDRLGAHVDEKVLEDGFFEKLTSIDFHSILLKPERKESKATTLSVPKRPEEQRHHQELTARAHLDVLCAAFIVEAFNDDRTLYDLVVRIATGALVSQVVLNVQDPGKTVSLLTLRVMLDAPFVMSVLNLSSEESFEYATELKNALKEHEASVEVFRHSLEEVKDNLRAVLNGVAEGIGYGATARRLQAPAFQAYVSGVLKDLEGAVARAGIRIADTPTLDSYYRHFTAEDEEFFFGMLGSFWNPIAQERDAASIAGVMRLRQGRSTRMSAFHQAQSVFVTQNPRVADCSARMVVSRKLAPPGEVPPAITDRFLAGLIWILYGGKAVELTRYRLIASCTAALEVRNDVMSKMNGFLRDIDETKATQFRAMMTNERAGQHLMQLTLGDSILISSTADAEQILEQLEAKLEEKHQAIARQEIAEATERAAQLVRDAEAERERQAQRMRDANANEMLVRGELDDLRRVSEREKLDRKASEELRELENARATGELNDKLRAEREARIDEKLSLIQLSVDGARIHARRRAQSIALAAGVLSFVAALLGTEIFTQWGDSISIVGAALAGVLAVVSFWNNPQLLFDHWLRRTRDRKFAALANEYKVTNYVESFRIDWESGGVSRRPGNPVS